MWKYSLVLVILLPLLHFVASGLVRRCSTNAFVSPSEQLRVSVIVSPVPKDGVARHLVLSWENASPVSGDWIGLFNKEPAVGSEPLYVVKPQGSSGWVETESHETPSSSHDLGYSKKCLGFWAAYISGDSILASSCLQTEPTWMSDIESELSPLMLRQIFLPGTHDTGAYAEYDPSTEDTLIGLIIKYTIAQEEDILGQLIHGVRYLDIRVGYYSYTDEWWVNHGIIPVHPLQTVFDDIKTFLKNTNEIVILDFHGFPEGFGSGLDIHERLLEILKQEFGDIAAPSALTWNATLHEFWSKNRRLLLTYNNDQMVDKSDILWPAVSQQWGDVQTLDALYTYLSGVMKNPPNDKGWSAMAELTPTVSEVITDKFIGLRRMADMVNQNVTTWFRGIWGQTVNIVSPDFFRGTGLVEAAIDWNKVRAQQLACDIA